MVPLLQRVTFGKRPKSNQKVSPRRPAPRLGSACLRSVFIWGHRLRSASLRPPLDVFDFVERRYAPTHQMNTSTQPPEGAGRARSRAGELTLGLMSGEERVGVRRSAFDSAFVGARLAREGGLPADPYLSDVLGPIVGASLLAMTSSQTTLFNGQQKFRSLPTMFSGCPSDVASLAFCLSLTHSAIGLRGSLSQA